MTVGEQRTDGLKAANRIRAQRAQLRGEVKMRSPEQGRYVLADAVEDMPDWLETIDVWELLTWAPGQAGVSPSVLIRADQWMVKAGTRGRPRLSALSKRQRSVLAECLRTGSQRFVERAAA